MICLLDTNICIYIINKRPAEVLSKLRQHEPGEVALSSITVSELYYGVYKSARLVHNLARLAEFMVPFSILAYDDKAAKRYGEIRAELEKKGQIIGPLDLQIAAHALSTGLTLVTNNTKEFKRVKGLRVENWVV